MAIRIEVRRKAKDTDYFNAIICETQEEADVIQGEWERLYQGLNLRVVDTEVEQAKAAAEKTATEKAFADWTANNAKEN